MRVVVATDDIGSLSSARAGALIGEQWSRSDVTVLPVGEAGAGFLQAAADQLAGDLATGVVSKPQGAGVVRTVVAGNVRAVSYAPLESAPGEGIPDQATSVELGAAIVQVLDTAPAAPVTRLVVDLTGTVVHDGGAGLLSALGALADAPLDLGVAGLAGLSMVDLDPVRRRLAGVELVGVVPSGQATLELLGLRGITSLRGRGPGADPARLLATDAALGAFARLAGPGFADVPGAGACGGLGFAILALGGRLVTGPGFAFENPDVRRSLRGVDLVVTGCTTFDFARRGGGVVAEAARVATELLCPCIAVAGEVLIGAREMRTMGIEAAYAVRQSAPDALGSQDVTGEELAATARRVARSWQW